MIGALKEWFYTVKAIDKHICNLYDAVKLKQVYVNRLRDKEDLMQHQIDQLSAAIQDLRKEQLIRREAERGPMPVVVDSSEEPKRKPPPFPWLESVPSLEYTIRNKMSQLAGSSENFIRSCRKKDCHVLVSKTTRVMLDQSGKTDKLREYPHGYIEMRHKRKRTSAGNPMRKYYTFETPQGYENAKKALEQMKCPYTTGKAQ